MSSTTKLKMNYRKFNTIWTTVVAVLVVVAIAATVVMNFFSLSMEIFLGRGARVVEPDPEMSNVDTAYYESNAGSTDELNERTNQTAQAIAEQGIVLMKNNNDALPIAKQSKVTPFGYRYGNPIYGGIGLGSVNTAFSRIYTAKRALSEFFTVNSDVEKAMDEARREASTPMATRSRMRKPALKDPPIQSSNSIPASTTALRIPRMAPPESYSSVVPAAKAAT